MDGFLLFITLVGAVLFLTLIVYVLNREKVDAWIAKARGTKGAAEETFRQMVERQFHGSPTQDPAVPASVAVTPPAAAPSTPVAAPSDDGGTVPNNLVGVGATIARPLGFFPLGPSTYERTVQPAANAAIAKDSAMPDKGIVTAGQLLAGWVLPDSEADPPIQGVPAKRHVDIMYLTKVFKRAGGNNVFEDVILGSQESINVVRNYAHTVGANLDWADDGTPMDWAAVAAPDIQAAAEASIKATLAGWAARGHPAPTYDFSRYYKKPSA